MSLFFKGIFLSYFSCPASQEVFSDTSGTFFIAFYQHLLCLILTGMYRYIGEVFDKKVLTGIVFFSEFQPLVTLFLDKGMGFTAVV